MSYYYNYNMELEDALESIMAVNSVGAAFSSVLQIAVYVLTALAIYTIAKRRGIRKPWLSWIPVLDVWILGSISDQYRYVVKGENKSKRKALLTLSIVSAVIYAVYIVLAVVMVGGVIVGAVRNVSGEQMLEMLLGPVIGFVVLSIPMIGVAIAHAILYFMALYDVYTSCDPGNNVLYLVLSIIPGISLITKPLFLFLCREKDEGMPPRRQETPSYIPEEAPVWQSEPQEELWQEPDEE